MSSLLTHLFNYAEIYTLFLVWTVVPLSGYTLYLFVDRHYGMPNPAKD